MVAQDQDPRFDGAGNDLDRMWLKRWFFELERGGSRHGEKGFGIRMD
jgi:hypothetical protein